jgi:hypothetical protein
MAGAPDADSAADTEAAIKRTVLDYFEGWFEGDAARMERALHPELPSGLCGQTSQAPRRWPRRRPSR